jgi:type I restriction enzyme S subunit
MERLPYIANEDLSSWTGKLLKPDPQPSDAESRRFLPDDILFNKLRPYLAKVYHAPFAGVSSAELLCLRPSNAVLPRYLFYVVSSEAFVDAVNAEAFGSKMPRADWEIVGHQTLLLPSLDVQTRIAQFLDENTARIDELIDQKRALLDRLTERRQAIISQAVTRGLRRDVSLKESGIDWLGQVPVHWDVLPLRRVARRVVTGRTPPSAAGDFFTDGEIPWYTPGDFDGLMLGDAEKALTRDAFAEGHAILYPANTLLFVGIGATLGKVAIAPAECASNQQINAIIPDEGVAPAFLGYFLHGFRTEVRMMASGNTLPILNQDKTKAILIVRPPFEEQQRIASHLLESDRRHADIVSAVQRSIKLLQESRSGLITSAVTGAIGELQ